MSWTGSDELSGIDYYEVKLDDTNWIGVGTATSYTFTALGDKWHTVTVRAMDKSGNSAESSVSFGVNTSIWSTNGPYQGIPLFGLIGAIIIGAIILALLFRRRKGGPAVATVPPPEEPTPQTP